MPAVSASLLLPGQPCVVARWRRPCSPVSLVASGTARRSSPDALLALGVVVAICLVVCAAREAFAATTPAGQAADSLDFSPTAAPEVVTTGPFFGGVTDTIFVDARRDAETPFPTAPAVVTVVDLETETGGADLAELLSRTAGLQIRRYGGLGAEAVPSIRGASGAQVAILIDGMPLVDAQEGTVDLASLPLERFERAEVYRGQLPARFGGLGGAGAINLISRSPGEMGSDLRLFAGSHGDAGGRYLGNWHAAGGRRTGLLLVHGRRIDNRYSFLDHRQTFHNPDDDIRRRRRNAQFSEYGSYLTGRSEGERLHLSAASGYYRRDGGRPGPLGYESPHAALRLQRGDGRLAAATASGSVRLLVTASQVRELLHDDLQEIGWDPPGTVRSTSSDLAGRLSLTGTVARGATGAVRLLIGADWRRQWYSERLNANEDPWRVRTGIGASGSLQLDLWGPRLTVLPAWRWQRLEDNFPPESLSPLLPEIPLTEPHVVKDHSPSIAAIWEVVSGRLFVEGHGARTVRPPTWVELFGHRGGIVGNRKVVPERITSYDLALRWRGSDGTPWARLVLFALRTDSTIVFRQTSQRTSKAFNIGAVRARGLEVEMGGWLPDGGSWSASLTWQRVRDDGIDPTYNGKEVPFLPPLSVAATLERPFARWRCRVGLAHEAANYRDRYNHQIEKAPARTLLNLALSHTWDRWPLGRARAATITAEIVNVTDNGIYDVEGFPLPGRTARVAVHLR